MPSLVLHGLNSYLADFSPVYYATVGDLDLAFYRSAYRFEDFELSLKSNGRRIFYAEAIDVSLAWRELLNGRVLMDVDVFGPDVRLSNDTLKVMASNKDRNKSEADALRKKMLPVSVETLTIRYGMFSYSVKDDAPVNELLHLAEVHGTAVNVTPENEDTPMSFQLSGRPPGSSKLEVKGEALPLREPVAWDVDAKLTDLPMRKVNSVTQALVPITFNGGILDAYAEVKSEEGRITGYVKPFLEQLDVIGDQVDFSRPTHAVIEGAGALGGILLKNTGSDSVAMKLEFQGKAGGDIEFKTMEALKSSIENAFEGLEPGVENSIRLE